MTMHLEVFDKKYLWEIETRQFFLLLNPLLFRYWSLREVIHSYYKLMKTCLGTLAHEC